MAKLHEVQSYLRMLKTFVAEKPNKFTTFASLPAEAQRALLEVRKYGAVSEKNVLLLRDILIGVIEQKVEGNLDVMAKFYLEYMPKKALKQFQSASPLMGEFLEAKRLGRPPPLAVELLSRSRPIERGGPARRLVPDEPLDNEKEPLDFELEQVPGVSINVDTGQFVVSTSTVEWIEKLKRLMHKLTHKMVPYKLKGGLPSNQTANWMRTSCMCMLRNQLNPEPFIIRLHAMFPGGLETLVPIFAQRPFIFQFRRCLAQLDPNSRDDGSPMLDQLLQLVEQHNLTDDCPLVAPNLHPNQEEELEEGEVDGASELQWSPSEKRAKLHPNMEGFEKPYPEKSTYTPAWPQAARKVEQRRNEGPPSKKSRPPEKFNPYYGAWTSLDKNNETEQYPSDERQEMGHPSSKVSPRYQHPNEGPPSKQSGSGPTEKYNPYYGGWTSVHKEKETEEYQSDETQEMGHLSSKVSQRCQHPNEGPPRKQSGSGPTEKSNPYYGGWTSANRNNELQVRGHPYKEASPKKPGYQHPNEGSQAYRTEKFNPYYGGWTSAKRNKEPEQLPNDELQQVGPPSKKTPLQEQHPKDEAQEKVEPKKPRYNPYSWLEEAEEALHQNPSQEESSSKNTTPSVDKGQEQDPSKKGPVEYDDRFSFFGFGPIGRATAAKAGRTPADVLHKMAPLPAEAPPQFGAMQTRGGRGGPPGGRTRSSRGLLDVAGASVRGSWPGSPSQGPQGPSNSRGSLRGSWSGNGPSSKAPSSQTAPPRGSWSRGPSTSGPWSGDTQRSPQTEQIYEDTQDYFASGIDNDMIDFSPATRGRGLRH